MLELVFCLLCFRTSCSILLVPFLCRIKKRFIIPKDGNMEAKNISSSAPKAQRENLLLEVVTRGREKRGFLGYLRRIDHIFHTLHSFFFVIFSSFYLCALFKRCNEASRQRHNSLRRTREKLLFFNKLGSFLCCGRVIYVRRYFIFLLMYEGKLLCTDYNLLLPLLFWSL